jgi:hypothetical protein
VRLCEDAVDLAGVEKAFDVASKSEIADTVNPATKQRHTEFRARLRQLPEIPLSSLKEHVASGAQLTGDTTDAQLPPIEAFPPLSPPAMRSQAGSPGLRHTAFGSSFLEPSVEPIIHERPVLKPFASTVGRKSTSGILEPLKPGGHEDPVLGSLSTPLPPGIALMQLAHAPDHALSSVAILRSGAGPESLAISTDALRPHTTAASSRRNFRSASVDLTKHPVRRLNLSRLSQTTSRPPFLARPVPLPSASADTLRSSASLASIASLRASTPDVSERTSRSVRLQTNPFVQSVKYCMPESYVNLPRSIGKFISTPTAPPGSASSLPSAAAAPPSASSLLSSKFSTALTTKPAQVYSEIAKSKMSRVHTPPSRGSTAHSLQMTPTRQT